MTIERQSYFYEDFTIGQVFTTPSRTVGEYEISAFAGLSGDYNPIHTDAVFGEASPFGQRIAHGLLGLTVMTGLSIRLGIWEACTVALLGIEEWRFVRPILAGDTVHATVEIVSKRQTSDQTRGILDRKYVLLNQRDEVLQHGRLPLMVLCRPLS